MKDDITVSFESMDRCKITMKAYYSNFGLQTGILEDIEVKYININRIKDDFLLKQINISIANPLVLNKKPNALVDINKRDFEFEYPLIVKPNELIPIYFTTHLHFNVKKEDELYRFFNWVKEVQFEINYTIRDGIGKTETKTSKFSMIENNFEALFKKYKEEEKVLEGFYKSIE